MLKEEIQALPKSYIRCYAIEIVIPLTSPRIIIKGPTIYDAIRIFKNELYNFNNQIEYMKVVRLLYAAIMYDAKLIEINERNGSMSIVLSFECLEKMIEFKDKISLED